MKRIRRLLARDRAFDGEVGLWVAALDDVRRQTRAAVAGLSAAQLAWKPPRKGNSIGQLLRHIAIVELDWILSDVCCGEALPKSAPAMTRLEEPMADPGRRSPAEFARTLDFARATTKRKLRPMKARELDEIRVYRAQKVRKEFTVRWILYHLVDHEAQHKGQILSVRRMLGAAGGE